MKKARFLNFLFTIGFLISFTSLFAQERLEVGNMILEDVPEVPQEIKSKLKQYQNTRSASLIDWLPDDHGMLMATRFGNTTQLHTLKSPGGARNQITFFDEPVGDGAVCPSSKYDGFMFTKDIGGNEFDQIYWFDRKRGTSEMLSDGKSVNMGLQWSNKGDKFAFTSNRRNGKDFDVYTSDMTSRKKATLKIEKGGGYWIVTDWSPDDTKLLVIQYLSRNKSNSYVMDLETNELTQINDPDKEAIFLALNWDQSGEKVYIVTDDDKEFSTLATYDLKNKKIDYITHGISWDVEHFTLNRDRSKAAFTVNENGNNRLYLMNTSASKYDKVPNLPFGAIYGIRFHPTKNELGMVLNTVESPGDIFSLDIDTGKTTKWTDSEVGGLSESAFPVTELIHFPTFDQVDGKPRMIPAFVYKPKNVKEQMPVLVSIHGGPEGQHSPLFRSFYAYLTNELGIAIIAPNVRGSSGYGKEYLKLDNGFKREDSVKDIGKLLEWIAAQPQFDKDRIAVYGGSYGGYMVLASMFHYSDQLRCGVDIVGISNFVTFLENTEAYRRDLRRAEYGDERNPEMREHLLAISPTNHVKEITKPLFVIQGANDPRVPASESEQMVKSIRANQGKVWYMLAKDEGHGFRKKENRDRMTEAIALFLKENLSGEK